MSKGVLMLGYRPSEKTIKVEMKKLIDRGATNLRRCDTDAYGNVLSYSATGDSIEFTISDGKQRKDEK